MPNRMVSTAIWSDERFTDLSAHAQLVYLRLVTGEETNTAGATEVRPKRLAVDTNLGRAEVEAALEELVQVDLVRRYDEWLWMPSWIKYQMRGAAFLRSSRQAAKGTPDSLRKAIARAIDAHVGKDAPDDATTGTDETRTHINGSSRRKRARPPAGHPPEPPAGHPPGSPPKPYAEVPGPGPGPEDLHLSPADVQLSTAQRARP